MPLTESQRERVINTLAERHHLTVVHDLSLNVVVSAVELVVDAYAERFRRAHPIDLTVVLAFGDEAERFADQFSAPTRESVVDAFLAGARAAAYRSG